MGLRIRKSYSLGGGFRINVSGSGVGYSWGGKGYRVTHMANGRTRRTATIPGTGISYVSESGGSSGRAQSCQQPQEMALGQTEQHESADRTDYTDCEYADLMKQLQRAATFSGWRGFLIGFFGLCLIATLFVSVHAIYQFLTGLAAVFLCVYPFRRRLFTVRLDYDLDESSKEVNNWWLDQWEGVLRCKVVRRITQESDLANGKVYGGAGTVIGSTPVKVLRKLPPYIKTNARTLGIQIGKKQSLYFLPDKYILVSKGKISAFDTNSIRFSYKDSPYICYDTPPADTEVLRMTWEKVNADGSPDKRFAGNRQLPICKYGEIALTDPAGLDVVLQFSNASKAAGFVDAQNQLEASKPRC